jgi:RsiW-degrading membrane proteinase PrsW (M82 family)
MSFILQIVSALITFVLLGILVKRMIERETPEQIGKEILIASFILGAVTMFISGRIGVQIMGALMSTGKSSFTENPYFNSVANGFVLAAFPEELIKLIAMIALVAVFRKKIRNVYEVVLIGALIGFGFSVFENYSYAEDLAGLMVRIPLIAGHLAYNMIMGYYLGRAEYARLQKKGSVIGNYLLALFVPSIAHALYDAVTAFNPATSPYANDQVRTMGMVGAGIIIPLTIALQIFVLLRCKKDAAKLCGMELNG